MLCPPEQRMPHLLKAGVPKKFLAALDARTLPNTVAFVVSAPEASPEYYVKHPELLRNYPEGTVIPLGQNCNADTFYDCLKTNSKFLFVTNTLEGTFSVVGTSHNEFARFLAQQAYELNDETSIQELANDFSSLGFSGIFEYLKNTQEAEV